MVHPLRNILNKLRWDTTEKADDYLITYRHRGAPDDSKTVKASAILKLGKSYFTLASESEDEVTIPFHRVLEVRNKATQKLIWKSRRAI